MSGAASAPATTVVLRASGLGDLCTAVPAIRAIRRARPDDRLVLCTPASLRPLVDRIGAVDELSPTSGLDAPLDPALSGAAVAVNLHGRGPQSRDLLRALRPGRVAGFAPDGTDDVAAPRWRDDEHEVVRWCRLVTDALGVEAGRDDLRLLPAPDAAARAGVVAAVPEGHVVVHPGAASRSRRWPPERFARVVRHVLGRGIDVTVTGGPDEVDLADTVATMADAADDPRCRVLAGRTDLGGLLALVERARLVVCGDTGVAHVASALGRPSVVLFGPVSPARWGPPANGPHTVLWAGGVGDPHATTVDPGLLDVGADEVVAAVDVRLRGAAVALGGG